jgi:hypothetical protein
LEAHGDGVFKCPESIKKDFLRHALRFEKSGQGRRRMDRSDDGVDSISEQAKGKIQQPDDATEDRNPTLVYSREFGWGLGRNPISSFTSNLSLIAGSAKLISGIAVVAILYFGREVFVPLAVAVLLTFVLAPPVRVLRRWRFGRIRPSSRWF